MFQVVVMWFYTTNFLLYLLYMLGIYVGSGNISFCFFPLLSVLLPRNNYRVLSIEVSSGFSFMTEWRHLCAATHSSPRRSNFFSSPSCRKILPAILCFCPKIITTGSVPNLSLNENMLRLNLQGYPTRHEGLDSAWLKFNVCMHVIGLQPAKKYGTKFLFWVFSVSCPIKNTVKLLFNCLAMKYLVHLINLCSMWLSHNYAQVSYH